MSWKKFRELFNRGIKDEHYFILGIDIGNATSSISYFDLNQNTSEIIDISGGYGKPSVPTVLQYINETKEWVFGEYAMAGRTNDRDKTFSALVEKLGTGEYVEVSGKPLSVSSVLSIYIKELIGNCRNINPRAEIAGIVVSAPRYMSEEAKAELQLVFKQAGYEKQLMGFYDDRECILNKYYFDRDIAKENVLIIDFGAREVRGGAYEVNPQNGGENINIECQSFLFDKALGTEHIDRKVTKIFTEMYCNHFGLRTDSISEQQREQIVIFAYQHKDMLFQKNSKFKPIKLYFNFAYPPFQQTIGYETIEKVVNPLREKLIHFIKEVLSKPTASGKKLSISDINTVVCVGGGFEMLWARTAVIETMRNNNITFYRNSKGIAAEGASIIAASELSAINRKKFIIKDRNRLDYDIGFKIMRDSKERFFPIVESNSFWWQERLPKQFILTESTERTVNLEILKRDKDGTINPIKKIALEGLPERPKGTTRMLISLVFKSGDKLFATIKDLGFGELFPANDYEREFAVDLLPYRGEI